MKTRQRVWEDPRFAHGLAKDQRYKALDPETYAPHPGGRPMVVEIDDDYSELGAQQADVLVRSYSTSSREEPA